MHKKMIHDIRYVGLAGEINFSKEPYMYQDTDLFNYNIEYDLNYFPSGRGGKVKRFKQSPQVNILTLGVINRIDVRELVSKLERHFQVDINAKTPAKLFVNGSYTECYIVSSMKTYFNRFLGINFITLEILRENPVWTTEEEYSYQRADLQTNPYDLNLIKPPYDFSELKFTQPAKPLKEANLIKNGWDDFDICENEVFIEKHDIESSSGRANERLEVDVEVRKTIYIYREIKFINSEPSKNPLIVLEYVDGSKQYLGVNSIVGNFETNGNYVYINKATVRDDLKRVELYKDYNWGTSTKVEAIFKHIKISTGILHLQNLSNKKTHVRGWGSNNNRITQWVKWFDNDNDVSNASVYIKNLSEVKVQIEYLHSREKKTIEPLQSSWVNLKGSGQGNARLNIETNEGSMHLDFIASDPIIYEDDGSMIYDIEEYDDKYRVRTMNSHSKTKMKFPIKKSVFKNEQYTHSLYVENNGNDDVLFKSEEGLYLENPVVEIKPDEQGTYSYTGAVSQDSLYTNFELATKEVEDELDLVLAKPAVRYGDKPFDWPPEEEIIPLRLPTHIPFWITADDSIKYISNNSIGDTLAKITIFGPIKNPTLYIGSNTYRVYEELLENERIEIDQGAKTVTKITSSGDRVNVFHLRDKEHSVFKPIPEGENTVTQNDDFSYTIILYHERNEPKWT